MYERTLEAIIAILVLAICCVGVAIGAILYVAYLGVKWLIAKYKSKSEDKLSAVITEPIQKKEEPMVKVSEREAFEDAILEIGYLRDYNYRFIALEDRAYELMSKFYDSPSFLADVQKDAQARRDYVSEFIWLIASLLKEGASSDAVDERLRPYFMSPGSLELPKFIPEVKTTECASKSQEHHAQLNQRNDIIKENSKTYREASPDDELSEFKNTIYQVKLLGHEDSRFTQVALKAHNVITDYGDSPCFYDEVDEALSHRKNFESEVIVYIIRQKRKDVSDSELIKKIRKKYLSQRDIVDSKPNARNVVSPHESHQVKYVEVEITEASKKLRAKAKIAHKHRAIQYANIIGGELAEEFKHSSCSSFYEYVKEKCKGMASKGYYSITGDDFCSRNDVIVEYKKAKSKEKNSSVDARLIVPQYKNDDERINALLNVLNKLTSMKLPRYEMPMSSMSEDWYQREYKRTNPLDVYNDLVESEYGPASFTDKRFAVLYQLILFVAECLESGMTEDETLKAISSLKVIRRNDLKILRDMASRYKGLSKEEKKLVEESEILGSLLLTNLYIILIRHYKSSKQSVTLNQYIISVLLKQYKDSQIYRCLLKYIYLRDLSKSRDFIENHIREIKTSLCFSNEMSSLKDVNDSYYSINDAFSELDHEYNAGVGMTRYNFKRDGLTPDMIRTSILNRYIPKRFDGKGRFCVLMPVDGDEVKLFTDLEAFTAGETTYMKFPIPAMSTHDVYQLLLTCKKQMRKEIR